MTRIASQKDDFPQWYLDCVEQAELADHADVRGCIIFRPYGFAIWEAIQRDLDPRIKALGVENAYFPLFIPESYLAKEKEHVEGFAPQCAVVTHGGGKELSEKLYVRPTSETIIYASFAKWIHSYRDLPLKVNQWANMVRWELRPRPFLRTMEFLWHEGHTCHATKEEADTMAETVLHMYETFDREFLALPVLVGKKPEHEKFAGALYTLTTEALARDGKAIQAGTSHNLGQGFSEAFNVSFLDEEGKPRRPWMTSWAVSTRLIGTLIVVHGDEKGLRLPPVVAPMQVVIVPIYKSEEEKTEILKAARKIEQSLRDAIRVRLDDREEKSPGFKFNEWEVKGVPLRIEIGPKDLAKKQAILVRRDTGEKSGSPLASLTSTSLQHVLDDIQSGLLRQAQEFLAEHTKTVRSEGELVEALDEGGFVWAPWNGDVRSAQRIQEKTKATIRLVGEGDKEGMALFAKAY